MKFKKAFKYSGLSILGLVILMVTSLFTIKKLDQKVLDEDFVIEPISDKIPQLIPSYFEDGERFYVKVPTKDGDTLMAFCDSGGGISMIIPSAINQFKLSDNLHLGILKGLMPISYIFMKDIAGNVNFPMPEPLRSKNIRTPFSRATESLLIVPPMDEEMKMITEAMPEMDVFFGQNFFMYQSWTIDYPNAQIWVNTPLKSVDLSASNTQRLGLKKNAQEKAIFGHGSFTIQVEGEDIDVLFDTGATFVLSEIGKQALNTDKKTVGGSFIANSVFDRWQKEHPEWKIYAAADMGRDIIEVPSIKIGELECGPVLFSKRPDENWSEGMNQSMDKVVKGAIGGSALKYFKVTADFREGLIKFER